ncbi:hypothetical protein [Stenotrophomonas maltophilia]|uniref:hypothetical protein n=1 Tax=Stenotrophomonas maltophilia TaxID=40324 RepID=UPI001F41C9C6|nr:hypothetical protein [Stenotrophomonas maltophilia]MCF3476659.1 hypothetical protein [Stenotrophomonas maltophilia]
MSLQLVLQNYIGSLKERNELDALLPELLIAMGHSVLSRPQTGVPQAGVDILSSYTDSDGNEQLYLFIIKFGDIRREDLFTGQQAIQPSAREACTDFARNRLTEAQRSLLKNVVVVSSGVVKQEAATGFAGLADEVNARSGFTFDFWGIDQLTPLIEKHIFDETLLLGHGKSELRAALAGLGDSQASIRRFEHFVEKVLTMPGSEHGDSPATKRRKFLRRCAAAAMGHGVLVVWGGTENNLKPAVVGGEYLALRMWSSAVHLGLIEDAEFQRRLNATLMLHVHTLMDYFHKTAPVLKRPRALVRHRPNPVFYADVVFEELGRLSTLLLLLQRMEGVEEQRRVVLQDIVAIINANSIVVRPLLDGQGIDLSLIFVALLREGAEDAVGAILQGVIQQLRRAVINNERLPVDTDLLEDAIAVHFTGEASERDFFKTTTLVPMLATITSVIQNETGLAVLRDLVPRLSGVTLERWYSTQGIETLTGSDHGLGAISVSRVLAGFEGNTAAELEASLRLPSGAADPSRLSWHAEPWSALAALSARLHRHPLPTWYIAHCREVDHVDDVGR